MLTNPHRDRRIVPIAVAALAGITFAVLFFTAGDARADYCNDSSCTSTVPPTTDVPPTSDVTTTAAPTTTTTVAPSTTTQPPAPSTSTTTTSVVVGPPPTVPPSSSDIVTPPQVCVIRTGIESSRTYAWYYLAPPDDALYYSGSQALEPFAPCYVPHPSQLPVTGRNNTTPAVALVVCVVGAILIVISRRRSES